MRTGLFLPIFGELSDPRVTAGLAAEAEGAGFDGVFVWDHVQYRAPATHVADAWITLAAMAVATERVRIGPLVTPLGVGTGRDSARELSAFGEELDNGTRGAMLDEALDVVTALWSGDEVRHAGTHYAADRVTFQPTPVQRPGVPLWVAGRWPNRRPLQRAARYDGYFPIDLDAPGQLAELVGELGDGPSGTQFEIVVEGWPGDDPAPWAAAGATWWLVRFSPFDVDVAGVRDVIAAGPPA